LIFETEISLVVYAVTLLKNRSPPQKKNRT